MIEHPVFEIVTTTAGAVSIRNKIVNEIMHNPVGPWFEANSLYIEQANLFQKMMNPHEDELVIYDVGLGAASNAVAALHCADKAHSTGSKLPLRIISFERDLELLTFTLQNIQHFDYLKKYESALKEILTNHYWESELIHWELLAGDFHDLIVEAKYKADLIFYDPYSPNVNAEMWTTECFKKLLTQCHQYNENSVKGIIPSRSTILYTYSQATPTRATLLAAGFFVGHGKATGLKHETTQAATSISALDVPLGERWISRWKKSHTRFPIDWPSSSYDEFTQIILNHPQFAMSTK